MNRPTFKVLKTFRAVALLAATLLLQSSVASSHFTASKTVNAANDTISSPSTKGGVTFEKLRIRKEEIWWQQIGGDVLGEGRDNELGYSVDMSADGKRIVVGAINNDGNGPDSGHVRVFEEIEGAWVKVGQDIDGEDTYDSSGYSVGMSSNGMRVIIGAYTNDGNGCNSGHARIYEDMEGLWVKIGDDIDGEEEDDWSGSSVDINADGTMVIIGAPRNEDRGFQAGHARVFREVDGAWVQVGDDIDGETKSVYFGFAVAMNSDGKRVVIGGSGDGGYGGAFPSIGHARVFLLANNKSWVQYGPDIDGEAVGDESGISVDMNDKGSRIIIGAHFNDGKGSNAGHARVYEEQGLGNEWKQIGADIDGDAAGDESGSSVRMSSDGKSVIVGAKLNDGSGTNSGQARIYHEVEGTWIQVANVINGVATGDQAGFSVGIDSDGTRVIVGFPYHDGNGQEDTGLIRVFALSNSIESDSPILSPTSSIPPTSPTSSIPPTDEPTPESSSFITDEPTPESSSFILSRPSYFCSTLFGLVIATFLLC